MTIKHGDFLNHLGVLCDETHDLQSLTLNDLLSAIPRVDQLRLPNESGAVLVRADLDVPVTSGKVADSTRVESCESTINYCLDRGSRVVIIGHIGRNSAATLEPVIDQLSNLTSRPLVFVRDWFDVENRRLSDSLIAMIQSTKPASVLLLENIRRYSFERSLWKVEPYTLPDRSTELYEIARQVVEEISPIEVNEAIAASNIDASSSAFPLVMDQTGLGFFIHEELTKHASRAVTADLLIFSGLKANKLDDLEGILSQGQVRDLIVGGSLAMPLVKGVAQMAGQSVSIGLAESDPNYVAYVDSDRILQAERILSMCRSKGTTVHLPTDYVLDTGQVASTIPIQSAQMDIGPETRERFRSVICSTQEKGSKRTLFLNGVMGKVEDEEFAQGTKAVFEAIRAATVEGMKTYVGGGDGRAALFKLGYGGDVTHAFTAGGTILKLMSGKAVPYLLAMYLQNKNRPKI